MTRNPDDNVVQVSHPRAGVKLVLVWQGGVGLCAEVLFEVFSSREFLITLDMLQIFPRTVLALIGCVIFRRIVAMIKLLC